MYAQVRRIDGAGTSWPLFQRLTTNTLSEAPMAARNSTPPTQSAILRDWRNAMRDCGASEEEIRRVEKGDLDKPWKKESTNAPRNAQQS